MLIAPIAVVLTVALLTGYTVHIDMHRRARGERRDEDESG
jgi:hypothetical protein